MVNNQPAANNVDLPVLILTGASGFIGSYMINAFKDQFQIYAIARRSQKAARVPPHLNIHWMRVDISQESEVKEALKYIQDRGGADYLFHLAGFFDFDNVYRPEYDETNVRGTLHVLKYSRGLNLKRFIFASSLTVSNFDAPGQVLNEESIPDATFPYAVSKAAGEEMMRDYAEFFPTVIVRFAAIFSDWCQYNPLNAFMNKWLSKDWDNHILVGKGRSAIPYLHINNLLRFFNSVMLRTEHLPRQCILIASTQGCTSHHELFNVAMHYNHLDRVKPMFLPRWIARIGVVQRDLWGRIKGQRPFERFWMLEYIDKRMEIDRNRTGALLKCAPNPRYHILRRLPFLIANMKRVPHEWHHINQHFPYDPETVQKNLAIYRYLWKLKDEVIDETVRALQGESFPTYRKLNPQELAARVNLIYSLLEKDIMMGDRTNVLDYAHLLAVNRMNEGYPLEEVCAAVQTTGEVIVKHLLAQSELKYTEAQVQDDVMMTLQMAVDEIVDTFEGQLPDGLACFNEEDGCFTVSNQPPFMRES